MLIPQSAKGADARRGASKEHLTPLRGALEAAPVLHVLLQSAKGADARRGVNKEHLGPLRGALEAAPVLHVFLRTHE